MAKSSAEKIWTHCDKDEILAKLLSDVPIPDIVEWLSAKYEDVKELQLPRRVLEDFKKNNLDFYHIMKTDLATMKSNKQITHSEITAEIQGTSAYKKALENYTNSEVDVRKLIHGIAAAAQLRTEQVFNELQLDPSNFKFDRMLVEWFVVLKDIAKECNDISNPADNIQIGTVNQINIQVMDQHINTIYDIIREILADLDYDTSIKFIEIFNERMTALKASENMNVIPVEHRLAEATNLAEKTTIILNKP
jgi:hypothetical protein